MQVWRWTQNCTVLASAASWWRLDRKVSVARLRNIQLKCRQVGIFNNCLKINSNDLFLVGQCLSLHGDFKKIVDPLVLEMNLKLLWSCGVWETENQDINNVNFRYAAYRTLDLWMNKNSARTPHPSCLVNSVREKYPDQDHHYTGFLDRSPGRRLNMLCNILWIEIQQQKVIKFVSLVRLVYLLIFCYRASTFLSYFCHLALQGVPVELAGR